MDCGRCGFCVLAAGATGAERTLVGVVLAMAVDAPRHLQRRCFPHQPHLVDRPVARRAADTFVHVNAVIEVGEVR